MLWCSLLFTKANYFLLLLYQSLWQIRIILLSLIFGVRSTLFNEVPCFGQAKLKHLIKSGIKDLKIAGCWYLLSSLSTLWLHKKCFIFQFILFIKYICIWRIFNSFGGLDKKNVKVKIFDLDTSIFIIILRVWKSTHSVLIKIQFKLIVFGLCKYIFRNLCRWLFLVYDLI